MNKHTPGPWSIDAEPGQGVFVYGDASPLDTDDICEVKWRASDETTLANARLIAAAPELLEALEELCSTLGECGMTVRARAAIAKATGEA